MLDRERVADQIFRELKNEIIRGTLPRGARLPAERELALKYQVSNPTVREAIRGLSLLGLVDVRHGSGAYVKADFASLIALTLGSAIQLDNLGINDVLGVTGSLVEFTAVSAARAATPADRAALRDAIAGLDKAQSSAVAAEAVRAFYKALTTAAHNPLLSALCLFLVNLQIELANQLAGDSTDAWRKILARLRPVRASLVEAIISRDEAAVSIVSKDFHRKSVAIITSLPKAKAVRIHDPELRQTLFATLTSLGTA